MAVSLTDLEKVYDSFLSKGLDALIKLQKDTQMEDEHLSNVSSSVIAGAMNNSVAALQMLKDIELVAQKTLTEKEKTLTEKEKTLTEKENTLLLTAQKNLYTKKIIVEEMNILDTAASTRVKDQQELGARLNNGGLYFSYTYDIITREVVTKTLVNGSGISIYEAKINLTQRQEVALDDARRVKKAEIVGKAYSLIGSGGATIPAEISSVWSSSISDI